MSQTRTKTKNVFLVAPTEMHLEAVETLKGYGEDFRVHPLLEKQQIHSEEIPIKALMKQAREQLDDFPEDVDAILCHWDFPVTLMVPLLCQERGLRAASLESVIQCSHKYWSRKAQRESIAEVTAKFELVDPFEADAAHSISLAYPYWLKPVKGFSSMLGFYITSDEELAEALDEIRESVQRLAEPFDKLLKEAGLPQRFLEVGGAHCLAEEYLKGVEVAHAGYVQDGKMTIHGTLDMVREDESFTRFLWPSQAPERVHFRMKEASEKFLKHIGYNDGCFNAEYFWEPETDRLRVIEFNPRISQSHTPLCLMVDGRTNHQIALDVSLGRKPNFSPKSGPCDLAAKFLIRTPKNGTVNRVPTEQEIEELQDRFPNLIFVVKVREGQKLDELLDQDAYTYKLGEAYLGGKDEESLLDTYWELLEALPLEVDGVEIPADILGARRPQ